MDIHDWSCVVHVHSTFSDGTATVPEIAAAAASTGADAVLLTEQPPSGDAAADGEALYAALREGRCYLSLSALAPAIGTAFWAEGEDGAVPMGGQARPDGWTVRARLPRPARLRLLRDGAVVAEVHGAALDQRAEGPGAYRLEAWLERDGRERAWVITNPIYLR